MEPFTLIIMMGSQFEETQILNLGRAECVERLNVIERSRHTWNFQLKGTDKGQCVGANGSTWPTVREITRPPVCANCGWDLPGRLRI